jgi:hypothetical protein
MNKERERHKDVLSIGYVLLEMTIEKPLSIAELNYLVKIARAKCTRSWLSKKLISVFPSLGSYSPKLLHFLIEIFRDRDLSEDLLTCKEMLEH